MRRRAEKAALRGQRKLIPRGSSRALVSAHLQCSGSSECKMGIAPNCPAKPQKGKEILRKCVRRAGGRREMSQGNRRDSTMPSSLVDHSHAVATHMDHQQNGPAPVTACVP